MKININDLIFYSQLNRLPIDFSERIENSSYIKSQIEKRLPNIKLNIIHERIAKLKEVDNEDIPRLNEPSFSQSKQPVKANSIQHTFKVKENFIPYLIQIFSPYFDEKDIPSLKEALNGKTLDEKLIFRNNAKSFVDVFYCLFTYLPDVIVYKNDKKLCKEWIQKNFLYQRNSKLPAKMNEDYIHTILEKSCDADDEPKSRIVSVKELERFGENH